MWASPCRAGRALEVSDGDPTGMIEAQAISPGPHRCLVGEPRFELGASSSRTKRATVLRHSPTICGWPKNQRFGCAVSSISVSPAARR